MTLEDLKILVDTQAEDEGLWFDAQYVTEAYLQRALRELHDRCEKLFVQNEEVKK